ncbi:MAG: hypothetical protein JRG80_19950 [Deltaproteobacteria bacterium]|nr:hypothetical protein [Deltaproteobacteria bacterium]
MTLNFNQQNLEGSELVYHAEGVQNTIDVMRSPSGATALVIGGNVEADNSYRQRRHFVLKGHLPLLFLAEPKSVLVVGLGMGITLQATARHPGLERIDVVELSPEILEAQSQLGETNGHVIENPLVHVRIDDVPRSRASATSTLQNTIARFAIVSPKAVSSASGCLRTRSRRCAFALR